LRRCRRNRTWSRFIRRLWSVQRHSLPACMKHWRQAALPATSKPLRPSAILSRR
jgi:hypothetical protein